MRKGGIVTMTEQQSMLQCQPHTNGGTTMERCEDCNSSLRKIGHDIYYCDDCDKIITKETQLMAE